MGRQPAAGPAKRVSSTFSFAVATVALFNRARVAFVPFTEIRLWTLILFADFELRTDSTVGELL